MIKFIKTVFSDCYDFLIHKYCLIYSEFITVILTFVLELINSSFYNHTITLITMVVLKVIITSYRIHTIMVILTVDLKVISNNY